MNYKFILLGIVFAALWASASAAAKIAIVHIEPLVLFQIRFFLAGVLLILFSNVLKKEKLPSKEEWKQLCIFGFLNTTLYLSFFVLSLKEISAGIGSLSTSTNSLFISVLSTLWLGEKIKKKQWLALILGFVGVGLACYPLLIDNFASPKGLLLILLSMLSYSVGTIYYSNRKWNISRYTINGWQVLLGGLFMIPFTVALHEPGSNSFNTTVLLSVVWLVLPVSIMAVQLWLYLLKVDTVKASFFLFLCPIFGFVYANILLGEPITWYTIVGTTLVLIGLYLGQSK
jgi:probable blue pigment (indigoidine) exporter